MSKETLDKRCHFHTERLTVHSWKNAISNPKNLDLLSEQVTKILSKKVTESLPPSWQTIDSIEKAKHWILARDDESFVFLINLHQTNTTVGLLIISPIENNQVQLGYLLSEKYWGQGMASELIAGLVSWCKADKQIEKITGGVATNNHGSAKVLTKNGFKISELEGDEHTQFYSINFTGVDC